jgi:hypothetical protein
MATQEYTPKIAPVQLEVVVTGYTVGIVMICQIKNKERRFGH